MLRSTVLLTARSLAVVLVVKLGKSSHGTCISSTPGWEKFKTSVMILLRFLQGGHWRDEEGSHYWPIADLAGRQSAYERTSVFYTRAGSMKLGNSLDQNVYNTIIGDHGSVSYSLNKQIQLSFR